MQRVFRTGILILPATIAVAACGGGGGGSAGSAWCESINGKGAQFSYSCTSCTNIGAAADGDLFTFAGINGSATLRATNQGTYPAGSNAGIFFSGNGNATAINTYLNGTLQETDSASRQITSTTSGTGAAAYLFFHTTKPFNAVEAVVSSSTAGYEIYEVCADGHV